MKELPGGSMRLQRWSCAAAGLPLFGRAALRTRGSGHHAPVEVLERRLLLSSVSAPVDVAPHLNDTSGPRGFLPPPRADVFPKAAGPVGGADRVSAETATIWFPSAVAMDAAGNYVVGWSSRARFD